MPKSCTALKGLTFPLCLVTALDLHCLPSVHLSPLLLCLLHQVFQNPHSIAAALEQLMVLPDVSCALLCPAIQGSPLWYSETGLSPKAQVVCSELTAHCSCVQIRLCMETHISHELYV